VSKVIIDNAELRQLALDNCQTTGQGDDLIRRAALSAPALANLAQEKLGILVSEDTIRRLWNETGIYAFQRGGARPGAGGIRPGAGRPRGSENKHSSSQPKAQHKHNLSIGTAALVGACMSAYEVTYEEDSFDYCKNEYTGHREVWKYTGSVTRPYDLPSRYSPAPMAVMGRSSKPFRSSQEDVRKRQSIKGQ
jgi:hypothetical protein